MKYELAKQLKDAGFPQEGEFWWFAKSVKENGERKQLWKRIHGLSSVGDAPNEKFVDPTLEELISACGDRYWALFKEDDGWYARPSVKGADVKGSTPSEAVANLWLELNKK